MGGGVKVSKKDIGGQGSSITISKGINQQQKMGFQCLIDLFDFFTISRHVSAHPGRGQGGANIFFGGKNSTY